jgi:outer membrane protein insertion porin family
LDAAFAQFAPNIAPAQKRNGFWHFMKYKIGEPPALLENVKPANIVTAVENRLQNRGHFRVKALAETKVQARTGRLALSISPGQPYTIRTIVFPSGNQSIISDIRTLEPATLVKPKTIYNLQALEDERKRVDAALKEKGYFYFKPDYLLFSADTTVGNRYVDLALGLKADVPADASLAFRFRNIYVSDDYSFRDYMPDTTLINNVHFVSQHHQFRPSTILNAVRFQKDSLYSRTNHYNTLRNLMGIGVYRFVNAQFTLIDSMPGYLDVSVLLTPVKQKSLSLELNASVKTTNYIGPGVNVNFKNRNFLGGAELLSMTLGGTVETQFKGDGKGQTSYQTYLDASLSIPRLVPFQFSNRYLTTSIPKTIISVGGGIYSRVNLYELRSFSASLGYNWKPKGNISHLFRPIETSYTDLAKTSQEFNDYLQENPSVQRSFEEQFIIGGNYEFSNSFYVDDSKKHLVSLNESADLSGNLTSLLTTLKYGSSQQPTTST